VGPLLVINGVISPISRVFSPQLPMIKAIYRVKTAFITIVGAIPVIPGYHQFPYDTRWVQNQVTDGVRTPINGRKYMGI